MDFAQVEANGVETIEAGLKAVLSFPRFTLHLLAAAVGM